MEGGMPALLPMEAGKSAFDDARAEAQATGRQQRLGITEISEQARMQAGQLAGLDDGELMAGGVQHMQSIAKTEAIRIEGGLQGGLMPPGPHRVVGQQQARECPSNQFGTTAAP